MAVYPSRFTGNQIDDVIGLFNQKGLNDVVGIIEKNEDGTFSIADLSWVADKSETVNAISYDSINKKIIQSIDGVDSDVVSVATLMDDFGVGEANGIVPLNSSSKIDSIFLPSYVDDVIEGYYYNHNFYEESTYITEIVGESGKIYIDLTTNKTYRWGGSTYVEVSPGTVVEINRDLSNGIKLATITVNGTTHDLYTPINISAFTNDSGYITGYTETDPIFNASPAAGISATDISNWNNKEIFYVEYDVTTYAEVLAAYNADKMIICQVDAHDLNSAFSTGNMLKLLLIDHNTSINDFSFGIFIEGFYIGANVSSDGWTGGAAPLQSNWALNDANSPGYIQNKPIIPSISLNGSSTTSASFYAPTTAGTSGQVLTSNGNGAPTWAPPSGGESGISAQIIRWIES